MHYSGYGAPITCPRCGTLNNRKREECRYCNGPLENYCTDDCCYTLNRPEARFCKKCGQPTIFNKGRVFDANLCTFLTASARNYFAVNGDPDSPEAKAEQARKQREARREMRRSRSSAWYTFDDWWDDDIPEPPLDDDYIPYY